MSTDERRHVICIEVVNLTSYGAYFGLFRFSRPLILGDEYRPVLLSSTVDCPPGSQPADTCPHKNSMTRLTLIVAATKSNGIGQNGRLPWRLPQEMAYFARVTSNAPEGKRNAVVMGRNTWESIPTKFRPLPRRLNLVISRKSDYESPSTHLALFWRVQLDNSAYAGSSTPDSTLSIISLIL